MSADQQPQPLTDRIAQAPDNLHARIYRAVYRSPDGAAVEAVMAEVEPELAARNERNGTLVAKVRMLQAELEEMTRCRDAALRALHRDDIATDIDVEETIANALCGPGWWDSDDGTPRQVARALVPVIRPALAKATQQLAAAEALADRWDNALAVDKPYARALRAALTTAPAVPSAD